MNIASSKLLRF